MARKKASWATWLPVDGKPGGTITGSARKITLHTTEGPGLPNWHAIRSVPHLTVNPATGEAWQHVVFDRGGYALGSPGYPRSPNNNAGLNIQIEIIGYARLTSQYDEKWYKRLAVWLKWLTDEWDVPKVFPFSFGGPEGYGTNGAYRIKWETYRDASGIVSHSNTPFNTHWDPGNLSQKKLLRYMKEGEDLMAITKEQFEDLKRAAGIGANQTLGDYNAEGEVRAGYAGHPDAPNDAPKPERGDVRLRQIENKVDRILKRLDK
jgi:hypothetical protein